MDLGFYKWKYLMATFTSNWVVLGEVTKQLYELSLVKRFKVLLARCPPLRLELQAKVRGARHPLQTREKTTPLKDLGYRLWSDEPGNISWIELRLRVMVSQSIIP